MAVAKGVTEVADSEEEEPMTSSECDANSVAERTDGLHADHNDASRDVDASNMDHAAITSDVAVPRQGVGAVSGKNDVNPELSQQCVSEQSASISEMPVEDNGTALPKSPTEEAQFGKNLDARGRSRDCSPALQDSRRVFASSRAKTGEPTAAHASTHPASDQCEPSAPISQESDQPAMEDSGTLDPSENAVRKSPTMPASTPDVASALMAKASPSNLTAAGIAASGPSSLLESAGDYWSNTALQSPAADVQDVILFTPPNQTSRDKSKGRGVGEEASPPRETMGSGLDNISTARIPTSDAQQALPPPAPMSPQKTSQEITLTELKAQKDRLLASLGALPAIRVLMEESASADSGADGGHDEASETDVMSAANGIVKEHIKLLHEYNELKDVGQGLMGLIADQRGVRIVQVQDEFGIGTND